MAPARTHSRFAATDRSQNSGRVVVDRFVQEQQTLDRSSPPAGALTSACRVLIVDDNEDGAEMLAAALSNRGYTTRVAHDAAAALLIAAEFRAEVAFLDIGLPVMDGYELAAHLRASPGLAGIHLVAWTGHGQAEDRRRTSEAGFRHHLVKPVDVASVESVLADRGVSGG